MKPTGTTLTLTRLALAAGLMTIALTSGVQAQATRAHGGSMKPAPDDAPSTRAFKEADMRMMQNMEVTYTGDPDVDFRRKMIPHHQGAIDMAKAALAHAKDEDTKKMARMIIEAQEKEIAEMQSWLKKRAK